MLAKKWNHLKDTVDNLSQPSLGITQRKSAIDDLKATLEDVAILDRLDQNSSVQDEDVTWGRIIYSLSFGIRKDMKLKTTNQSILRIQESLVVIKKCVEKAGFKLSNNLEDLFTIIEDIFLALEDEWNADIAAYCINILKVVLVVPIYALKMKQELMTQLLEKYMKLVVSEKNTNLNDTYCKHINFLVTNCRFDMKILGRVFSRFMIHYFDNLELNSINNSILSAFNFVLQHWSLNHETEKVFEIIDTEKCSGFVLIKWMETKKDQQEEYISFFQLYLKLGYTLWGTTKEVTLLPKLYAHIVSLLSTSPQKHGYGSRTSLGNSSTNVDTSANFLDLVSDVLIRSQKSLASTETRDDSEEKERDTKRRKTSTLSDHFEEFIFGNQPSFNWMTAFASVVAKKGSFFKPDIVINYATKLTNLLTSSAKEDVRQSWILQCLYGLVTSSATFIDKFKDQSDMQANFLSCWNDIFEKILPKIQHQHFVNPKVGESCMRLLSQIILFRLISANCAMKIQENIWKLIVSGKASVNDSVSLLLNFMDNYEFREDSDMSTGTSLREIIVRWLFSSYKKYSNLKPNPADKYRPKDIMFLILVAIRRMISPAIQLKPKEIAILEKFSIEHPLMTLNYLTKKDHNNEDTYKRIASVADSVRFFNNKTETSIIAKWNSIFSNFKKDIRNRFVPNSQRSKLKEMIVIELISMEEEIISKITPEEVETDACEKCLYFCRFFIFVKNILVAKKSQIELTSFESRLHSLVCGLEHCSKKFLCKDSLLDVIDYLFTEPSFNNFLLSTLDNLSSNLSIIHASQESEKRTNKPTIQIYDAFDLDNDMEVVETKSEFHYSRETSSKSLALTPDKKKETISTNLSLEIFKVSFGSQSLQKVNEKKNNIFAKIIQRVSDFLSKTNSEEQILIAAECLLELPKDIEFNFMQLIMEKIEILCKNEESNSVPSTQLKCISLLHQIFNLSNFESLYDGIKKDLGRLIQRLSKLKKANILSVPATLELSKIMLSFLTQDEVDCHSVSLDFFEMLRDPNKLIRLNMTKLVANLFEIYEDQIKLYVDICSVITPLLGSNLIENAATALLTLADIAIVCESATEKKILTNILDRSRTDNLKEMVGHVFQYISNGLEFPKNSYFYMNHNLGFLLRFWVDDGNIITSFPVNYFGDEPMSVFYKNNLNVVVPILFSLMSEPELRELAKLVGEDLRDLSIKYYAEIFSYCFPFYFSIPEHKVMAKKIFLEIMPKTLSKSTEEERNNLINENLPRILVTMLNIVSTDEQNEDISNAILPQFNSTVIKAVIEHLAKGLGKSSKFIFENIRGQGMAQKIILNFNQRIFNNHRKKDRVKIFNVLIFFKSLIDDKILCQPSIFRDLIHTCIRSISFPELHSCVLRCMNEICSTALQTNVEELGLQLEYLIPTLVQFVTTNTDTESIKEAIKILKMLVLGSKEKLNPFILNLDPFPESDIFQDLSDYYNKIRGECNLEQEIVRFIKSTNMKSNVTKLSSLNHLKKQINFRKDELFEINYDTIMSLVWSLLSLCSPHQTSDQIKIKAGECLGELGILMNSCISLLTQLQVKQGDKFQNEHTGTPEELIVYKLEEYLINNSVRIIERTSEALVLIFYTELGKEIFKKLPERMRLYLDSFKTQKPRNKPTAKRYVANELKELFSTKNKQFNLWLPALAHYLGKCCKSNEIYLFTADLCQSSCEFSEFVFPYFIENIVDQQNIEEISELFSQEILSDSNQLLESTKLTINTFNKLRSKRITSLLENYSKWFTTFNQIESKDERGLKVAIQNAPYCVIWREPFWREINLLDISTAAYRCSAYFTSLLFLELWCESNFNGIYCEFQDVMPKDELAKMNTILMDIFSKINEFDSIYGVEHDVSDYRSQIIHDRHEGQWNKVAGNTDMILSTKTNSNDNRENVEMHQELLHSLYNLGQHNVIHFYLKGFASQFPMYYSREMQEFQYAEAWRTLRWDQMDDFAVETEGLFDEKIGFHRAALYCLRALKEGDNSLFKDSLQKIRLELVNDMGTLSVESTKKILPIISQLQFFEEIDSFWNLKYQNNNNPNDNRMVIDLVNDSPMSQEKLGKVESASTNLLRNCDFQSIESLLTLRSVLLLSNNKVSNDQFDDITEKTKKYIDHGLLFASLARKADRFQVASNALYKLKCDLIKDGYTELNLGIVRQEAKLHWAKGDFDKAINLAKNAIFEIGTPKEIEKIKLKANLMYLTAKWLTEQKTENIEEISANYFKKAIADCEKNKILDNSKALFEYACFADDVYERTMEKQRSPEYLASQKLKAHKKEEEKKLKLLTQNNPGDRTYQKHLIIIQKELKNDDEEDQKISLRRKEFCYLAIENYVKCLRSSDKYDERSVFRFISLWFSNTENDNLNEYISGITPKIGAHKFLSLFYQIASRISTYKAPNKFQEALYTLIEHICVHYPYHSLYQIFALSNGDNVEQGFIVQQDKVDGAKNMLKRLLAHKKGKFCNLPEVVNNTGKVVQIYNEFADANVKDLFDEKGKGSYSIPSKLQISKVNTINFVHLPTAPLAIKKRPISEIKFGDDDNICIQKFEKTFSLVGGIHLPKIIRCVGTNGVSYKQLVKGGGDDLRQDAVMQQMFSLVNTLLKEEKSTRKRNLGIRTYRVVPLSPRSGILEWVENTMTLGTYLVGSGEMKDAYNGAHYKYRRNDWSSIRCRTNMKNATVQTREKEYLEVTKNFKPVFHHFFLENYHEPAEWFQKRLNYTRSVATGSMVGFILGLGDRHSQNILIDKQSGEIIHIDLGVAFDQGKALPTPEIVPFRLTRDIVDAMGVTGIEGVFRKCCEETLQVLRTHRSRLITIVEVFIHDPLYTWTLSPVSAQRRQREEEGDQFYEVTRQKDDHVDAERTLLRFKEKLSGYESGQYLNVSGHARQLINSATHSSNLCKMFHGWAPWV